MLFRVLGMLLGIFSLTMLPPIMVDFWYHEHNSQPFIVAFCITAVLGLSIWFPFRKAKNELKIRDGFIIVVLFWCVLGLFGAIPFLVNTFPQMSLTDAVFESVSGFTTTGATVIPHLDSLPHSILYYRQQLQLLGGLGIIILAVAILPMLGVGGMQLFKVETTGPLKDNKLTPRITEAAKGLWTVYLLLTALCIVCYGFAGMSPFDAVCYGFSTVATGGFAPHDTSLGYFQSRQIELIAMLFMFISAISFPLHFVALKRHRLLHYLEDEEIRCFLGILLVSCVLVFLSIFFANEAQNYITAMFHVVSFSTTSGFTSGNHSLLPGMLPYMLLLLGIVGGCAGSTSGGIKVIRLILLQKQGIREIKRLIHPQGIFAIKFQRQCVPTKIIEAVWGFLAVYVALFALFLLLLLIVEADFVTAYTVLISCLSNTGPALGNAVENFANLHDFSKWILSFVMIVGRLELFTVLVLLSPAFWRH